MKKLKLFLAAVVVAVLPFGAGAQNSTIHPIVTICEVENNGFPLTLFDMPVDGVHNYYLDAGTLGHGDEIVQVYIDPASRLFIPLGHTLAESQETLDSLQALFKEAVGTSMEIPGCIAIGFPNERLEPITVTHRKPILSHQLEFSVRRENYIRATYLTKGDMGAMKNGLKFQKKLHPDE